MEIWQSGYAIGFNNSPIRQQKIEIKSFDSLLSRSVISKFIEYTQDGNLPGYSLAGRTKHVSYFYNVSSNHIEHLKYIELLRQKITAVINLEDSTKK